MNTADLPLPVVRAVVELGHCTPETVAATLRYEAARRLQAAMTAHAVQEWQWEQEMLGLALGYLTAASRALEEAEAA